MPSNKSWPKIVWMTWKHKHHIPHKVHADLRRFAAEYDVRLQSDAEAERAVRNLCGSDLWQRYRNLSIPAHRADLWRYCVLWSVGGIYVDVKTWLIRPLDEAFPVRSRGYAVLCALEQKCVYNGVIAVPPRDPVMARLLRRMRTLPVQELNRNYMTNVRDFYAVLRDVMHSAPTVSQTPRAGWIVYQEREYRPCAAPDRYGRCFRITDADGGIVANTRHPDFPAAYTPSPRASRALLAQFRCRRHLTVRGPTVATFADGTLQLCERHCARYNCTAFAYNAYRHCVIADADASARSNSVAHGWIHCVKRMRARRQ